MILGRSFLIPGTLVPRPDLVGEAVEPAVELPFQLAPHPVLLPRLEGTAEVPRLQPKSAALFLPEMVRADLPLVARRHRPPVHRRHPERFDQVARQRRPPRPEIRRAWRAAPSATPSPMSPGQPNHRAKAEGPSTAHDPAR